MFFGNDRAQYRRFFREAWRKRRDGLPLEPLEAMVADVVAAHGEYHADLERDDEGRDYGPEGGEGNPFLHMGMHVAIHEQLAGDRPAGLRDAFRALSMKMGDPHAAEHRMMECLGEALWRAQRSGGMPDEAAYLGCVRRAAGMGDV